KDGAGAGEPASLPRDPGLRAGFRTPILRLADRPRGRRRRIWVRALQRDRRGVRAPRDLSSGVVCVGPAGLVWPLVGRDLLASVGAAPGARGGGPGESG